MRHFVTFLFILTMLLALRHPDPAALAQTTAEPKPVYLPLVSGRSTVNNPPSVQADRRINAPYFTTNDITKDKFAEMAVFWFGKVDRTANYTDVRVGYNNTELVIYTASFDRRLWYKETPTRDELTKWDAVTLYLNTSGPTGANLGSTAYRFDAQLNGGGSNIHQAAYRAGGSGWVAASVPFATNPGWRGERLNDDGDDRGWAMTFRIPYASLGLSERPTDGAAWGMALTLHDRDDAAGTTAIPAQNWPPAANSSRPDSWGGLVFGLPSYTPPAASGSTTVTIQHKLNGANVPDGMVGGGFTCGDGLDFWTQWGEKVYYKLEDNPNEERGDFNIQNQSDVADWPCFSKNYITFPLNSLPQGRTVVSAKLVLHQFGQSGAPGNAIPSLIQISTVADDWDEATLNWNNAPLAVENVSQAMVPPTPPVSFPGTPREWDVSRAVAAAYTAGQPLRLAIYSADSNYDSGKYFISSDTGDWNAKGRPTLVITLGTAANN